MSSNGKLVDAITPVAIAEAVAVSGFVLLSREAVVAEDVVAVAAFDEDVVVACERAEVGADDEYPAFGTALADEAGRAVDFGADDTVTGMSTEVVRPRNAFCSWIPPSWKLDGSKMMESPRGRPAECVSPWACEADCSSGGRGSSALIPKAKHSKEKARSRLPLAATEFDVSSPKSRFTV